MARKMGFREAYGRQFSVSSSSSSEKSRKPKLPMQMANINLEALPPIIYNQVRFVICIYIIIEFVRGNSL